MTDFTKPELRVLFTLLNATRDPAREPLQDKIRRMLAERADAVTCGVKVFELTLPLEMAVSMNRYAEMKSWMTARLRKDTDRYIMAQFMAWPSCRPKLVPRRWVRGTRYSSRRSDEASLDTAGFKVPVDRLVKAGILRGDTMADIERESVWIKTAPKNGRAVIEVFEVITSA